MGDSRRWRCGTDDHVTPSRFDASPSTRVGTLVLSKYWPNVTVVAFSSRWTRYGIRRRHVRQKRKYDFTGAHRHAVYTTDFVVRRERCELRDLDACRIGLTCATSYVLVGARREQNVVIASGCTADPVSTP